MRPRRASQQVKGPAPPLAHPSASRPRVYPPPAVLIEKQAKAKAKKAQAGALAKLSVGELRKRAKAAGVTGVSKLKKAKLVEALLKNSPHS